MYIARRRAFDTSFILRRLAGRGPPPNIPATIADNNRKVKAYQTLVHTRKLWEESSNEENSKAFKQTKALRHVKEDRRVGDTWPLSAFDAPEKHLGKEAKMITKKFEKVLHQEEDAPLEVDPNQLWYSPEELMPLEEGEQAYVPLDFDELDNTFEDKEETYDDAQASKVAAKMEEERKKKHFYDRLELESSYGPLKEGDDVTRMIREDSARLDVMDYPDTTFRPSPNTIPAREQDMMNSLYEDEQQNEEEKVDTSNQSALDNETQIENPTAEPMEDSEELVDEEEEDLPNAKKCQMCGGGAPKLHPMNVTLLARFVSANGDIFPRKLTGTCMRHQKEISRTFRKSKSAGLLSFKDGFLINDPYTEVPDTLVPSSVVRLSEPPINTPIEQLPKGLTDQELDAISRDEGVIDVDEIMANSTFSDLDESEVLADEAQERRNKADKVIADRLREPKRAPTTGPRTAREFEKQRAAEGTPEGDEEGRKRTRRQGTTGRPKTSGAVGRAGGSRPSFNNNRPRT